MLKARGFTLLEVLVTLIVLAIGMLGLANLQTKVHAAELESYQRAHAVMLLQDMVDRINVAVRTDLPNYVTGTNYVGVSSTGDATTATCAGNGSPYDLCSWSNELKGSAETSGGANVGAMIGARGCVELVQARNDTTGVCQAGIYRVSVVWQGLSDTAAPTLTCGRNLYGSEAKRRLISTTVSVGTPGC